MPPLVKGGQGRTDDSIRDTAGHLFWLAAGFVVVLAVLVLRGSR
jgi:hypothetical protein